MYFINLLGCLKTNYEENLVELKNARKLVIWNFKDILVNLRNYTQCMIHDQYR